MPEDNYYNQANHGPFELYDLGNFALEDGGTIMGCKLAYATFGTLNAAKDNTILVTTWWSGTSKIMEQLYIGEGRALDPAKYFIVVVNQIGNGLSTSPNTAPAPGGAARFPHVRIADDVRAQHKFLTETYGIDQLALVFGGSMGAQQTYEWAVRYPDMVKRAAPLAGTAKVTDHCALFADTLAEAITSDPAWRNGWYGSSAEVHLGLRRVAALMTVTAMAPAFFNKEMWRGLGFNAARDFRTNFLEGYFIPMDPNVLLGKVWKWQHADVTHGRGGDLKQVLGTIKAKVVVMPISSDRMFPPGDCAAEQAMIPGAELQVIESDCGHLGLFAIDPEYNAQIDGALKGVLAR